MIINILTVSPEYFESPLASSILGRASRRALVQFNIICLRDFADGKENGKKQVDDRPFGGGAGMLLKIEPIHRALEYLRDKGELGSVLLTSAQGPIFNQNKAQELATLECVTIICGHYEGVDERVKKYIDAEISLGQFVLTGGEPAAAVIADAVVRLIPGVVNNPLSLVEESHQEELGEIEYPQYTQPRSYLGDDVPEILLSGDHTKIKKWRKSLK